MGEKKETSKKQDKSQDNKGSKVILLRNLTTSDLRKSTKDGGKRDKK